MVHAQVKGTREEKHANADQDRRGQVRYSEILLLSVDAGWLVVPRKHAGGDVRSLIVARNGFRGL